MSILNSATILVRVISIGVLIYLLRMVQGAYQFSTYEYLGQLAYWPWINIVALALLFLLMWFLPRTVASIITPKHLHEIDVGTSNAKEIETAAIGIIGLWLLIWVIPDLVHNVFAYMSQQGSHAMQTETMGYIVATLIEGALGAWLLLRSHGIAKVIQKLRS